VVTDRKVRRKRPVLRERNKKVSAVHPTREQAVKHARSMASKSGSEVYVHDRQGGVREHDSYGAAAETHEEALGREVARVLLTRPDTGAVERQIAYRDGEGETFIVRVESYPPTEESRPGGRTDPVGRAPAESETYERLDCKEVRRRYPELWEKISYS
jgi:hypothetical protein